MIINLNNNQLELPLDEFNIHKKIKNKESFNQSLYVVHKGFNKSLYKKQEKDKVYKNSRGETIGFSISLQNELKDEHILYKKYKREKKKHTIFDIVIKEDLLINKPYEEIQKLINNTYNKAKKRNKSVFIYQLEDEYVWNKIWLNILEVFKDYPISVYCKGDY